MKTSINFKAAKSDSETHNFRKKTFDYIRKELTDKNEYWNVESIADRKQKIEAYCKEKSGRKLQSNAMPIREAVVVIREDTTMQDLHFLSRKLQEELGIKVFQIAIHRDEGHWDKETKEWKPNYHAHLVADWQDLKTGKTLKHQSFHYSKMQDLTAECLNMERGTAGSVGRLEAVEFKIQKKEEELKNLELKLEKMQKELASKTFQDLIIKEPNFLGFGRINTDKTIENYEKTFRLYNSRLLENSQQLTIKDKQIADLGDKLNEVKKELSRLKIKNTQILTDPALLASEKKKYLVSVADTLEKKILSERFKIRDRDKMDEKTIFQEMAKICHAVSRENNIPASAFTRLFEIADVVAHLFDVFSFTGPAQDQNDEIYIPKKKEKRRIVR